MAYFYNIHSNIKFYLRLYVTRRIKSKCPQQSALSEAPHDSMSARLLLILQMAFFILSRLHLTPKTKSWDMTWSGRSQDASRCFRKIKHVWSSRRAQISLKTL